jgi:hypothetical protein
LLRSSYLVVFAKSDSRPPLRNLGRKRKGVFAAGPNEHDLTLLSDGKTLMVVTRIDGGDGRPPYCASQHTVKNYHSLFSTDGGTTWTKPTPMRDVTGRGIGTAYPRLLKVGNTLLLSGGRLMTEGLIDIELWVNSDGMGKVWDQAHSISYQHNRNVVNPLHRLFWQVNTTDSTNSTTSYTSLVPVSETEAVILYECHMVSGDPMKVGAHGAFSMKITVA